MQPPQSFGWGGITEFCPCVRTIGSFLDGITVHCCTYLSFWQETRNRQAKLEPNFSPQRYLTESRRLQGNGCVHRGFHPLTLPRDRLLKLSWKCWQHVGDVLICHRFGPDMRVGADTQ
jgi:hypothetical protein